MLPVHFPPLVVARQMQAPRADWVWPQRVRRRPGPQPPERRERVRRPLGQQQQERERQLLELALARQRERAPRIGLPLARELSRLAGLFRCPGSPSFLNLPEWPEPWHWAQLPFPPVWFRPAVE